MTRDRIQHVDWDLSEIEKDGFDHYMLKEIYSQPESLRNAFRGRLDLGEGTAHLGGLNMTDSDMRAVKRIVITACGTSWHSGLIGKYIIENLARIPVDVEYASEFRYRDPVLEDGTVMFVISQSGETADTLAALRLGKQRGIKTYGIVNVVGSTIARETDAGVYIHAGPEIGVASTKAFTSQTMILSLIALALGRAKGTLTKEEGNVICRDIMEIPGKVESILQGSAYIMEIARQFTYAGTSFIWAGGELSRGPGGRAEAEGDKLHTRRGIPGCGNEARSHSPHRRPHAGGGDRREGRRLREGHIQHSGGKGPAGKGACHRH